MKFTVSTQSILNELNTLSGAISSNSVLPILEDFLFELNDNILTISASDLETSMSSGMEVEASEGGKIAIPAKILLDTLKALPDQPLDFDIDEESYSVAITSQTGHYKLVGENCDDFPEIPEAKEVSEVTMGADILLNAISKTLFAVSNDELRPAMTGVFVSIDQSGTIFVATDAHKLVRYNNSSTTHSEFSSFIVPRKAMSLLKNALIKAEENVTISYNSTNAFFNFGRTHLICRLIDSKFPDYNAVIPKDNNNYLTIGRIEFQNALRRISIYASKTTYQVVLGIDSEELTLSAQDVDFSNEAKETINCQYDGEPMNIAFNAKFLVEILGVLDTDEIIMQLSTPSRAGLIVPAEQNENEDLIMLVMPIMMNT